MDDQLQHIAVFDVDGTLIEKNIGVSFVKYLNSRHAIRPFPKAAVLIGFAIYKLKLASFRLAIRLGYWALVGLDVPAVQRLAKECFTEMIRPTLYADGIEEIRNIQGKSGKIILATGAHEAIAVEVGKYLGADEVVCTKSEIRDSKYCWQIDGPMPYKEGKRDLVRAKIEMLSRGRPTRVSVYTDEKKDLSLLDLGDEWIGVNADEAITAAVEGRGGRIVRFE